MKLDPRHEKVPDLSANKLIGSRLLFWLIMAAGVFVRLYQFGIIPGGINQDEAFAGYEAWSLLNYGIDTAGYHNPIYLTAWGSGMNALESYLMMPFLALFGLETWVIRLPQLLISCLSLWVVYLLVRRLVDEKAALLALFMLAISPWHILMSRWGLESNLAPGFLLFGLYFFVCGLEKPPFLLLSAFLYGLSLYCYATYWVYIPFIILFQFLYCAAFGKIRFDRYLLFSVLILAALALPLLLFLAINNGYMDEICTRFFSIPKILYMRTAEIALTEKKKKLELFCSIFWKQSDGWIWSSPTKYGLFYYFSTPFALLGAGYCFQRLIRCARKKSFCPEALILIQLLVSLPQCLLVKINVNKVNILFIPLIILIALGIYFVSSLGSRHVLTAIAAVYVVLFTGFSHYYFTEYREECKQSFDYGLEEALDAATKKDGPIYLEAGTHYPKVLFYTQYPVDEFREQVQYYFYPSPYLVAIQIGRFHLWMDTYQPDLQGSYILRTGTDIGLLDEYGFCFEEYGVFTLAYRPDTAPPLTN